MSRFDRTEQLIGDMTPLSKASVLLVGVGGVGGYAFETLVRGGIGTLTVVDGDRFEESNLNRQLLALVSTVGRPKVEVAAERAAQIDPACSVRALPFRFDAATCETVFDRHYDYVVDAIDSVADKVLLICECKRRGIPVVSAMGAGSRLDDEFSVRDIYETSYDGLAKAMRKRLREAGIDRLKVVCSALPPLSAPGSSVSYPPAVMGAKLAGEVIRDLLCR